MGSVIVWRDRHYTDTNRINEGKNTHLERISSQQLTRIMTAGLQRCELSGGVLHSVPPRSRYVQQSSRPCRRCPRCLLLESSRPFPPCRSEDTSRKPRCTLLTPTLHTILKLSRQEGTPVFTSFSAVYCPVMSQNRVRSSCWVWSL